MIIIHDEFKLIQQEHGWNLVKVIKLRKVGKGTAKEPLGEEYDREIDLESAVGLIIHLKLRKSSDVVSLTSFLEEYKKEKEKISLLLN
jgi:hypothetical protein